MRWPILHAAFDRDHSQLRQTLGISLAVSGTALLWFAAIWAASRRAAGAMPTPPRLAALLGMALMAVALAGATHAAWQARRGRQASPLPYLGHGLISLSILVLGGALSVPAAGMAVLLPFWLVLLLAEISAWAILPRTQHGVVPSDSQVPLVAVEPVSSPNPVPTLEVPPGAAPMAPRGHPPAESANDRTDERVLQRQVRRRTADGAEELSGFARIPLTAGQRMTSLHVAFCPPFARSPDVRLEQIDGPDAKVKKMQVLPYGARFDLRLADPCDDGTTILVQWSAHSGLKHGGSGT